MDNLITIQTKKCNCGTEFYPSSSRQIWCPKCQSNYARMKKVWPVQGKKEIKLTKRYYTVLDLAEISKLTPMSIRNRAWKLKIYALTVMPTADKRRRVRKYLFDRKEAELLLGVKRYERKKSESLRVDVERAQIKD